MDPSGWDARYRSSQLVWSAEPNRFVAEIIGPLPAGRALDLGTGEGRNAIWLAEHGWQVTGVDFSQVGLDKARRLSAARSAEVATRLGWVHADLLAYSPSAAAFDLVLAAYLQLPAPARRQVLRAGALALRPGGRLVVVGHHPRNLIEGVGGPQDVALLFGPDDVVADLAGIGLIVARAEEARRLVAGAEPSTAIDTVVVACRPAAPLPDDLDRRARSATPGGPIGAG